MSDFWRGRRVLVTGHTGFKGSWLCRALHGLGATVTGIALDPRPGPSAFAALDVASVLEADHRADIRDGAAVARLLRAARPEVVLHLAAQAFVGDGYRDPAGTFATNLGGTVAVLDAMRGLPGLRGAVIVTSDKVYANDGAGRAFAEDDRLGGADPYSASKAAAELAVASGAPASRAICPDRHGRGECHRRWISGRSGWCRTSCAPWSRANLCCCAGRMPRAPSSMCWTCCGAT